LRISVISHSTVIRNSVLIVLCLVTLLFFKRAKDFIRSRLDARKSPPPVPNADGQPETHVGP
jgi:hypothetical protein